MPIARPIIARNTEIQFNQPNRGKKPTRLIIKAITPIKIENRFIDLAIVIKVRILKESQKLCFED